MVESATIVDAVSRDSTDIQPDKFGFFVPLSGRYWILLSVYPVGYRII
jgi:hypothetical protein